MDIIFVRTRWLYDSYIDFWKLVELAGFPTCYTDEVDIERNVIYIVSPMNGEWRPVIDSQRNKTKRAELLMINLERPGGSGSLDNYITSNRELIDNKYLDHVFVCDKRLSVNTGFPYMMIGGHEGFGSIGRISEKVYDLITLCCYSYPHRAWMFQTPSQLRSMLGGMTLADNAFPGSAERDLLLRSSKAMLNIHQDGLPFCEPLRFIIAAMYGIPIFTEECDSGISTIQFAIGGFNGYSEALRAMLKMPVYERLCVRAFVSRESLIGEFSFRNCVMRAL